MKCPKCNRKIHKDLKHQFCIHCGYLDDEKQIHKRDDTLKVSDIEIYLGNDFDKIYRNNTYFSCLMLGPFYLCYRHYLLLGVLLFLVEVLFWYFWILCFPRYFFISFFVAVFITRVFFMTVNNMIYLLLCKRKIKRIKKRYGNNYLDHLRNFNGKCSSILGAVAGIGIVILAIFFILASIWKKTGLL